jgi:phage tail-like protein
MATTHPDLDKLGENHFILKINDISIGAFRECTGLAMEREVMEYAEGGQNDFVHKLPGRVKYPNLVLKRGITAQDELMKWFWDSRLDPGLKAIMVELRDTAQAPRRTWSFDGAYPLKWTGPNLNAGSDTAATEQLEIVHRGLVKI